jgi:hypothetical protein
MYDGIAGLRMEAAERTVFAAAPACPEIVVDEHLTAL